MKNFAEKRKFLDQSLEIMQTVLSIQKFTLTLNGLHGVKKREFYNTANIYLFKVSNRKTTKRCEKCSKLTIKTPERRTILAWKYSK